MALSIVVDPVTWIQSDPELFFWSDSELFFWSDSELGNGFDLTSTLIFSEI